MSSDTPPAGRNRLAQETSPYLLQHAANPVDWYPWGEEAFARARAEGKPILLSVGYSSCHWCHVMAHESFEDDKTAALMNRWFVNVKVDREERPDIDSVYMGAVQALTGQGGWPMTVFLTPDLEPFFAGTYFPPEDAPGRPGFLTVLASIARAWEQDRERVARSATSIAEHLREAAARGLGDGTPLSLDLSEAAVEKLAADFDATWGGFGNAPKFPTPSALEFLLAYAARVGSDDGGGRRALEMVLLTLDRMASGGIYDQLGGGFARYAVDREWVVPHFEKMLYDNAQLVRVYLHAYQWTGRERYRRIAVETLEYLLRDMRHPQGGFFAAEDADSEGVEGKFYVWSLAEVERLLGREAAFAAACLGVSGKGNFRDPHHPELGARNVLTRRFKPADVAQRFGLDERAVAARLEELRARLLEARNERPRPGRDEKILTSWNGLALAAFAEAGRVLREPRYLEAAGDLAAFLRAELWRDGRLLHSWREGRVKVEGLLEDYAYLGLGLVELYKASGGIEHLTWARELADGVGERFHDSGEGGFFATAHGDEHLILRTKEYFDQATPAGNAAAAMLLTWIARYYGATEYEEPALETVSGVSAALPELPAGTGAMLQALEFLASPRTELVIAGERGERDPFEDEIARFYLPWVVVAPTASASGLSLFEGRLPERGAVAYLCHEMVCELPARSPVDLREQLVARAASGAGDA